MAKESSSSLDRVSPRSQEQSPDFDLWFIEETNFFRRGCWARKQEHELGFVARRHETKVYVLCVRRKIKIGSHEVISATVGSKLRGHSPHLRHFVGNRVPERVSVLRSDLQVFSKVVSKSFGLSLPVRALCEQPMHESGGEHRNPGMDCGQYHHWHGSSVLHSDGVRLSASRLCLVQTVCPP